MGNLKGREEDNKSGTQRKSVSVDVDLCSTKHGQYHKEFLLTEREAAGERDAAVKVDQSDNIRLVKEESKHTNYFEEDVQAGHQNFTQAKYVSCPPLYFAGDVKTGSAGPCSQMQHEGPCVKYKRRCNFAVAPEFKIGHSCCSCSLRAFRILPSAVCV